MRNDWQLTLEDQVIYGALCSLAKEIGHKLKRSSFSSIIRESDDYGVAIVLHDFSLIAEAETTPLQMGPLANYCRGVCDVLKNNGEILQPDSIYLHNDPYAGASHSPDVGAIMPIFIKGKLFAFVAVAAHHLDIGAAVPGTCIVHAHDAYSEGLRLCAYLVELNGKTITHNWRLLADNVRIPKVVVGDLKAQVAACKWGANRLLQIVKRFSQKNIEDSIQKQILLTEMRMRAKINDLPNGHYNAEGFLDGYEDRSEVDIKIAVEIEVRDDEIIIDLSKSDKQLDHAPINMPFYGTTDMAVLLTLRTLLLPQNQYPNLPHNSGLYKPVKIIAKEGTIVRPKFPAPTIGRFCGGQLLSNLIVKALASVLPNVVCAGCSSTKAITFSGIGQNGETWVYMDVTEGAYGATYGKNGLDAVDVLYANTKNNPIEDIELHYPLRVEKYELREDSAGIGKWGGGRGPIRDTRILQDGFVSVEGDGFRHAPWGLFGGEPGKTGGVMLIDEREKKEVLPSKINNRSVKAGIIVRDLCPGGGGYGRRGE